MIKHAEIFFDNKICMSSIRDELYPPLPYNISSRFRHFINLIYKKESSKKINSTMVMHKCHSVDIPALLAFIWVTQLMCAR